MKITNELLESLKKYIEDNYIPNYEDFVEGCLSSPKSFDDEEDELLYSYFTPSEIAKIKKQALYTWQVAIFEHIDRKGFKDSDVYKRAFISKQTFSKIRGNVHYQPDKDTAIKICIGLKLTVDEAEDLMSLAGLTLSPSIERDLIVKFFLERRMYNIMDLNDALYELGLKIFTV